jgi:hypothetical protein
MYNDYIDNGCTEDARLFARGPQRNGCFANIEHQHRRVWPFSGCGRSCCRGEIKFCERVTAARNCVFLTAKELFRQHTRASTEAEEGGSKTIRWEEGSKGGWGKEGKKERRKGNSFGVGCN